MTAVDARGASGGATDPITRTGTFRYDAASDTLTWSDGVFDVYGHQPFSVTPTLGLLLDQCHPDDVTETALELHRAIHGRAGCVHAHRIVTPRREIRHVVIAMTPHSGDTDRALVGHVTDVSVATDRLIRDEAERAIRAMTSSRAAIEQAKGALMLTYGISADTAFDVLSWQSQKHNVKVRRLAEQFISDFAEMGRATSDAGDALGSILLTAHQRIERTRSAVGHDR